MGFSFLKNQGLKLADLNKSAKTAEPKISAPEP